MHPMDTEISMIRYEQGFQFWAETQGWRPTKRGWPDFFVPELAGGACVEVKKPSERLTVEQRARMAFFTAHGIPCYRWDAVSGLRPYDAAPHSVRLSEATQCASCGVEFRHGADQTPRFCSPGCQRAALRRKRQLVDGLMR
jgi:hypothetical protein